MSRIASTLALAILAPFLVLLAVAVRVDSPDPVLFRQTRVGLDGRPFLIFKFRTMVPTLRTAALAWSGAAIVSDVPSHAVAAGVPAKVTKRPAVDA